MGNGESSYRRFLKGDPEGFVELVRDYRDGLLLYINGFVHNLDVAEELCEDTFVKLAIKRPHFQSKSSFKTWLYAIGRNRALDHIRSASKRGEVCLDDLAEIGDSESLENRYLKQEQKILLHKAMKALKPEYRQALWLSYFEELSNKEIARIMKKSPHSIETLIYRAKKALKTELIKEGIGDEIL